MARKAKTPQTPREPTGSELSARRAAGIAVIVDRMASGTWYRNDHIGIARQYGIADITAAQWAGEASRQLRALIAQDREHIRTMLASRLEKYEKAAHKAGKISVAIQALESFAKIEGLIGDSDRRASEQITQFLSRFFGALAAKLPADAYAIAMATAADVQGGADMLGTIEIAAPPAPAASASAGSPVSEPGEGIPALRGTPVPSDDPPITSRIPT